jgi:competence protein ComEC
MFYLMAAFCVGPIILHCYGELLPANAYILFSFCCLSLVKSRYFLVACSFFLGFCYASFQISNQQDLRVQAPWLERPLVIDVYLCSVPRKYERYSQADYCLLSDSPTNANLTISRVRLSWSHGVSLNLKSSALRLQVKLKRARSSLNMVGGAYEEYLFYKRVSALGKISSAERISAVDARKTLTESVQHWFVLQRYTLVEWLDRLLVGLSHPGLVKALLSGERSSISELEARVLASTGTQHLLAISGLHVGIIIFLLYRVLPKSRKSLVLIFVAGLTYVLMVGFSESAQRALVMSLLAIAYLSGRWQPSLIRLYLFALFVVLLIDPLSVMNIGFWYSFLCVALLMGLSRSMSAHHSVFLNLLLVQCVLLFGMVPLNAWMGTFQGAASILANGFAVPWVSLFVLPLALIAMFVSIIEESLGQSLFAVLDVLLEVLVAYLESLNVVNVEFLISRDGLLLLAYLMVFLYALVFIRRPLVLFVMLCTLLIVLIWPSQLRNSVPEFVVFDAGQGLALAMIWDGQYWLYDTGEKFGAHSVVEGAVYPYLRSRELIKDISGFVVSHGDADHAGSAGELKAYLQPKVVWAGEPERLVEMDVIQACSESMNWAQGEGRVEVLYPFSKQALKGVSSNNHSCVLLFSYQGYQFLLMGDLEAEAEMALVERYRDKLKADILIAGHHGSRNASSLALLKHVQPSYLIVSAAHNNRFGHPHSELLDRARIMGVPVLSTAGMGAIHFLLEEPLRPVLAREERLKYWLD